MNRAAKRRQQKLAKKAAKKTTHGQPPSDIQQSLNIAVQHHQAGDMAKAESLYQQILQTDPNNPNALNLLGVIAHQAGKNDIAVDLIGKAIAINPDYPEAYNNLGTALKNLGKLDDAIANYNKAIAINPNYADAHYNLGTMMQEKGQFDDAIANYNKVVAINPAYADAHYNLGEVLKYLERYDEAIASYRRAITINPDHAESYYNLGNALKNLGKLNESATSYRKAIAIKPDYAKAHYNLGVTLHDMGKLDEAIDSYRQAIALKLDYAEAHNNLGLVLQDTGQLDEACVSLRKALAINPDYAEAYYNFARTFHAMGKFDEAIDNYRHALSIKPDFVKAHSNLIMTLNYAPLMTGRDFFATATAWARPYNETALKQRLFNDDTPERRLRLGYVSADFSNHPVGFLLSNILQFHDGDKFEVVCYSNSQTSDATTDHLIASTSIWRNVTRLSDKIMAEQIMEDSIDILIDLSGHTANNRLTVFAQRPAPVQVTWMGYSGTTGLTSIDYILADHFVIHDDEEDLFSEKVIFLPGCYLCFDPPKIDIKPLALPAKNTGIITFGSFNNRIKITVDTIALWSQILNAVAGSQMLLKTHLLDSETVRHTLFEQFAAHGIDKKRLLLEGGSPRTELLQAYQRIDIALDTHPFGGGVTTAEALWMGVPVITLSSARWPGRVGESILNAVGLPELVADNLQSYNDIAVALANNMPQLEQLHGELRDMVASSPLCDGLAFTNNLERVYRKMWRDWCTNKKLHNE